jgi:hypothetical protein
MVAEDGIEPHLITGTLTRQLSLAAGKPHRPRTPGSMERKLADSVDPTGGVSATPNTICDRHHSAAPNQRGHDAFHAPIGRSTWFRPAPTHIPAGVPHIL